MADIVEYLQNRISELKEELKTLNTERGKLEAKIADVAELYRATEAVLEDELKKRGMVAPEETPWAAMRAKLQTMSLKDAVWTIVSARGEEGIHADDILQALQDAGFPLKGKSPKNSIVSTIYHEIEGHGTYEKVAPNTFKVAKAGQAPVQGELVHVKEG